MVMKTILCWVGWFFGGLIENLKEGFLSVMGEIHLTKRPLWIQIAPTGNDVKGRELRKALELVKAGDILVRRYRGVVCGWFIPGRFSHSGVYIGDGLMIHAIGSGVQKVDMLDFLACDGFAILRAKEGAGRRAGEEGGGSETIADKAVRIAKGYIGYSYDYKFDICEDYGNEKEVENRTKSVYCHELVRSCFPDLDIPTVKPSLWNGMIRSGKSQFLAQSFFDSEDLEVVYDSDFSEARVG
jgi:hypothetical protein